VRAGRSGADRLVDGLGQPLDTDDPRCHELEELLTGLSPRGELLRRWALMDVFEPCSADGRWKQRVKRLLAYLAFDADELTKALPEAQISMSSARTDKGGD
jgi:hypothetical protein